MPLNNLKGIGDKKAAKLKKIGLSTYRDVLYDFPMRYIDRRKIANISEAPNQAHVTIMAKVLNIRFKLVNKSQKEIMILDVADSFHQGEIVFFSPQYIKSFFKPNEVYYFFGKIEKMGAFFKMMHPEYAREHDKQFLSILPVYASTLGLYQSDLVRMHQQVAGLLSPMVEETLPLSIIGLGKLCALKEALYHIHSPKDEQTLKVARYRLIYEELFTLQLKLIVLKNNYHKAKADCLEADQEISDFMTLLPFKLTNAQVKALEDIKRDLKSGNSMNRLIQGDVGSGKTIVAFLTLLIALKNGKQGVLMAPTAILARQHYESFKKYFDEAYAVEILDSSVSAKEKKRIKSEITLGHIDVVIGTHAVLEEDVVFKDLGVVITDEQHRFGVRQRTIVSQKGHNPHVLIMSATPIPRTLSLILYGDMDVSIVDEMPEGRKPIKTHFVKPSKLEEMYGFIHKMLEAGRQIYFVCPLVEDSETLDLTSATAHYEALKERFDRYAVGIVHGKMKAKDKDLIMESFKNNEIKILVSTTVIEVGINVPNASVMVILNSERFGLSQLHQLRGRVGRGDDQSYCFLLSEKLSKEAKARIETMVNETSGFEIADKDLELRGSGEIFGVRQHGLPELKLADLSKHKKILLEAQKHVKIVIAEYQLGNREMIQYVDKLRLEINETFTL
ncbi:ATP-dependent DNA helicase RecG [Fusibacter ferrireducens]|nr:ATP-dependent DNA helicase RecG [Fusibacter ferrireducens]